jgi:hypothetical protein
VTVPSTISAVFAGMAGDEIQQRNLLSHQLDQMHSGFNVSLA